MVTGEIRTQRFLLRPPALADAERITELVRDPRIYEKVARIPPGQSVEQTGKWILNGQRGNELGTDHVFLIVETGEVIGTVGAHRPATSEPFEIGYWIAPHAWGRGVATEAARALIGWLDARGQAGTLVSGHFADNPASGRVLEKLGFEVTETGPVYCLGRGREINHVFMKRTGQALV